MNVSVPPSHAHPLKLSHFLALALLALTLTRWLVPTEATAEGDTLWIAALWFLLGGACFLVWRSPHRVDLADLAVGLLIGGHVLSGLVVLGAGGDRRAALNLIWEWLSLGVFWIAWRKGLHSQELRRAIVPFMIVTAVTLSLWGLWQYFVWYPQIQARLGPLFDQLRELEGRGADVGVVRQQLAEAGVPQDGAALQLFENRLRNSREPFGPFALANTLGGLLAAWIVIAFGAMNFSDASPKRRAALLFLVPIALCLYLTNSRTAWGGLIAAAIVGVTLSVAERSPSRLIQRWLFPTVTFSGLALGVVGFFWIMQDVHNAPGPVKSLAYRGEYWIGTGKLLATTPWLGAGLGQFRDRYLAFKVAGSSEEIADAHNLFLDVWANGGLVSLVGLSLLILLLWRTLYRASNAPPPTLASTQPIPLYAPATAGFALAALWQFLSTGLWDEHVDRLLAFAVMWLFVAWLWSGMRLDERQLSTKFLLLAAVALAVHLLGAGGIAMPAVTQLLLLLLAWSCTPPSASDTESTHPNFSTSTLAGVVCLALFAACVMTGVRPVTLRQQHILAGDFQWMSRRDADRAEQNYRQAAQVDPWSAESWQRLAQIEFARALATPGRLDRRAFDLALGDEDAAIQRSPFRPSLRSERAEMLFEAAQRTRLPADWTAAADAYPAALQFHPYHVQGLAHATVALDRAGRVTDAADMARRALRQDELNHARGHADRYLPNTTVDELQTISGKTP